MAVVTESNENDNKNVENTKENANKKDSLQVEKVETSSHDDTKASAIQTTSRVETEPLLPSITSYTIKPGSSETVSGIVSVVGSENVIIGNNTYFKNAVRIKRVKQKVVSRESAANNKKKSKTENKQKASENRFLIRRWHVNTLGSTFIFTLGGILAVFFQNNTHLEGDLMAEEDASDKTIGYFIVLKLFYRNLNYITLPILLSLFILLLMANVLIKFDHPVDIKKRDVDTEEVYDDFMRPYKKVRTAIMTPEGVRIVGRTVWHAEPVIEKLDKIRQPIPWVIISHTATGGGNTQSECVRHVRVIQRYHKDSKDWDDIGYNFVVGGDGAVYCGRGWDHIGAHTLGYNRHSIGVAFLGTFIHTTPPKRQLEACKKLLQRGVAIGKLSENYIILGHRQLWATHSPGDKLFEIIKEWPHFVKEFKNVSEILPDY